MTEEDEDVMAEFGASEQACYEYPEDTDTAKAQRAAFLSGSAWASQLIEKTTEELTEQRRTIEHLKYELALMNKHREEWKYKYIALLSGRQTT